MKSSRDKSKKMRGGGGGGGGGLDVVVEATNTRVRFILENEG